MNRIAVMQITDSLMLGGMERMAVNVANQLSPERYASHLCTTRCEGPLAQELLPHVERLRLERRGRLDFRAVRQLGAYIQKNRIQIIHAHGTSLFMGVLGSLFKPRPLLLWHDNFGRYAIEQRSTLLYGTAAKFLSGVLAANEPLARWARQQLGVPANRVWYVPNFVREASAEQVDMNLPGILGNRIVCVANLRPEKDHPCLFCAMEMVLRQVPEAHLLLLGGFNNSTWADEILQQASRKGLAGHVTWLGERTNVPAILKGCDIGVLSSASEGLPLALLEYGMARLPAVATSVGQCSEVLDEGRAGLVVPPGNPEALANAIVSLLQSPTQRAELAKLFHGRVQQVYSEEAVMKRICAVYDELLGEKL